eukprot:TRINITY_DN10808_c0_g1_i1.p1 TRINITY_DN10808_c0_g1~~TRINITY_DN10808_c0_g1_i1.p1  ORF type:complete len:341 (-),score=66.99 TRINITY_DN10808_c0_g1_i1:477-1442(-)
MDAVLRTYGPDCDELRFFVAAAKDDFDGPGAGDDEDLMINLHESFAKDVLPDQDIFHRENAKNAAPQSANTIVKLLHMMRWAAEHHLRRHNDKDEQWWFCRLERDTFFIPENFRYLVASAKLDANEAHYLGSREFLETPRFGLVFNDGGPGVCLSSEALLRLRKVLLRAPRLAPEETPSFESCQYAAGHREDLMLGACLREADVFASPATTDAFGREWFSIRPLRSIQYHRPPLIPQPEGIEGTEPLGTEHSWNFWSGRSHIYLSCARSNRFWVVDTPVSFNSFKNISMFEDAWQLMRLPALERRKMLGGFAASKSGMAKR